MPRMPRYLEIMEWARTSVFENSPGIEYYVPPREVESLYMRLTYKHVRRLVFLVGSQGSGKTIALYYLNRKLNTLAEKGPRVDGFFTYPNGSQGASKVESLFINKDIDFFLRKSGILSELNYLFFDLPDYPVRGVGRMYRDMDRIMKLWGEYTGEISWVISVQKELFGGHYAFGKGEVVELRRRTAEELHGIYVKRMGDTYPFSDEALLLLGSLSRGICRRFMRYALECSEAYPPFPDWRITADMVRDCITSEVVLRDVDLELSSFLNDYEKLIAVRVLEVLGEVGKLNQKSLAAELEASESSLSRVLRKLVRMGWVMRSRGERNELLVSLA